MKPILISTNKLNKNLFLFFIDYLQEVRLSLKDETFYFKIQQYKIRRAAKLPGVSLMDIMEPHRIVEKSDIIIHIDNDDHVIKLKDRWYGV